jgi:hypothetical protein
MKEDDFYPPGSPELSWDKKFRRKMKKIREENLNSLYPTAKNFKGRKK